MSTSESDAAHAGQQPIHVAFVWHMHQPYYRSAQSGAFHMPWARLHAVKDYLDMVEILSAYPTIHQTFNLVPSLVEQLEDYAAGGLPVPATDRPAVSGVGDPAVSAVGDPRASAAASHDSHTAGSGQPPGPAPVADLYWQHTIKPAADLLPSERAFVVERMCERPDHPRARSHPRYLELAQKREAETCRGWEACSETFTVDELRDLQVWFNLAWCDPSLLENEPLLSLVSRGRDFREEDKRVLAEVQNETMRKILPAYRRAAEAGQIELSTTPYFHPILPLLANTDSARIGAGDTLLPHRRFAHPEDASQQVEQGVAKHTAVFGAAPRGVWCSEQAVGEDVLPLLIEAGIEWTVSDQSVLARSVSGSAPAPGGSAATTATPSGGAAQPSPYQPYLLRREEGEMAVVFRDHTLSDLIGFAYQNWDSVDAANDLLNRIRAIGAQRSGSGINLGGAAATAGPGDRTSPVLITIALDGENAWEYYPHDGRDFLHHLYQGLEADPGIRCVTVSEYLREYPATVPLDWLHTGSWIGGDLRTWSGDPGHNAAWDLLHDARDLVAARRREGRGAAGDLDAAWNHIMVAEGSDWFWWFGEHHHTDIDYVWDLEFRRHLQKVYRLLGEPAPIRLYLPVFATAPVATPVLPKANLRPVIDGRLTAEDGWDQAGILPSDHPSTMQRSDGTRVVEARFGWGDAHLHLLLIPREPSDLRGLEIDLALTPASAEDESIFHVALVDDGTIAVQKLKAGRTAATVSGSWQDVVEIAVALGTPREEGARLGLTLRVGRGGMIDHVFRSAGLTPIGEVQDAAAHHPND